MQNSGGKSRSSSSGSSNSPACSNSGGKSCSSGSSNSPACRTQALRVAVVEVVAVTVLHAKLRR